ncbi:SatD family protein [uncultured Aeromicrobium sp.]|uniref:SatD family protein n=1 Tax=uncultured Aeromicrobium sp. TaxID=337820 RepID=UPI0025F52862|nr:SatD family protein [uncultured Aeromicrobium sp.]
MAVAMIGDLVSSRAWDDRAALQRALLDACAVATQRVPGAEQPLAPTIGDEFQAVYTDLADAIDAVLVMRLALPLPADCRVGIGVGEVAVVGASAYGLTQDGSAWWAARAAVESLEARERRVPGVRTLVRWAEGHAQEEYVNGYVACRDHIVSGFDARQRRLALGALGGRTQAELAEDEGITRSAVSQSLRRSGALVLKELWTRS